MLALVGGASGCSLWRVWQPFALLSRVGYRAFWEFVGGNPEGEREQLGLAPIPEDVVRDVLSGLTSLTDAVILPRMGWMPKETPRMRRFLQALRNVGNVLIYEADDDIFSPWIVEQQARGLLRGTSRQQLDEERLVRLEVLRFCDGATVSTQRLATLVRQFVPETFPVEVVPNHIDWQWWRAIRRTVKRWVPPLTIGWAGGGRPDDDLEAMAWGWGQVAQSRPDVRFVVQGCKLDPKTGQPSLRATEWMRPILDHVPAHRIAPLPWLDIKQYPAGLLNVDIGCCPLAPRPFNRCKTPIKLYEYAAAGAAVAASPTVYGQTLRDAGLPGLVCETREDWAHTLTALVDDGRRRRDVSQTLRRQVALHSSLADNLWRWPAAWEAIVAHARRPRILVATG